MATYRLGDLKFEPADIAQGLVDNNEVVAVVLEYAKCNQVDVLAIIAWIIEDAKISLSEMVDGVVKALAEEARCRAEEAMRKAKKAKATAQGLHVVK
jgi:hypothetical protein